MTIQRQIDKHLDTRSRLLAACLEMWSSPAGDEISYRTLARAAGTAVSAIDYHFASIERLYGEAQAQAVQQAQAWLDQWINGLGPLAGARLAPARRAAIIAGLIDEWAQTQRPLAMAQLQACVATRRRAGAPDGAQALRLASHQAWIALWRGAWRQICATLGCADDGELVFLFHQGLGPQHLLRWRRPLDLALLGEDVALLMGQAQGEASAPVRAAYQAAVAQEGASMANLPAGRPADGDRDQPGAALDAAAADLLCQRGIGALTYRAVASHAGCTLGQAAWRFRTRADLLHKAFLHLYHELAITTRPAELIPRELMIEGTAEAVSSGAQPVLGAFDEIILHVARSPDHAGLAAPIRVFADPTARWATASLLGANDARASAQAPIFSALCRGLDHLALAHTPDQRHLIADLSRQILQGWAGGSDGQHPEPEMSAPAAGGPRLASG